jgi:hypothetical protein
VDVEKYYIAERLEVSIRATNTVTSLICTFIRTLRAGLKTPYHTRQTTRWERGGADPGIALSEEHLVRRGLG